MMVHDVRQEDIYMLYFICTMYMLVYHWLSLLWRLVLLGNKCGKELLEVYGRAIIEVATKEMVMLSRIEKVIRRVL
ncbi:MAG: hypothetical protein CL916_15585 [Deltaproteobacteria bacterium]|nr:hypothetical protein [Deltaproteobacteria bacterium]